MAKFPVDAPKHRVKALAELGFEMVREAEQIALKRQNADGTITPMSIPNHRTIKGSTLTRICTNAGIDRSAFVQAYEQAK